MKKGLFRRFLCGTLTGLMCLAGTVPQALEVSAADQTENYKEDGYDYDLTAEAVFEDIYERLNDMLFFCGYCELDPRNPFDWVILYCIYVEDLFDIAPKIQQLLGEVFREQE